MIVKFFEKYTYDFLIGYINLHPPHLCTILSFSAQHLHFHHNSHPNRHHCAFHCYFSDNWCAFSCTHCPLIYLFEKNVYSHSLPIFKLDYLGF